MSTWRKVGCCLAVAVAAFGAWAYEDDYVTITGDESVSTNWVDGRVVYVFTNTASAATMTFKADMTLRDALVVGGGGAGGGVIGGGGGGGGVVTLAVSRVVFEGTELGITVGRGGTPASASGYGNQSGGGTSSSVTFNSSPYLEAFGGGGGCNYTCPTLASGKWGSSGGCGANNGNLTILEGYHWTQGQGNPGAQRVNGDLGGGGGGAFAAGKLSNGGEGLTNAITGVKEVYGSGGGGGSRNGAYSTSAGNGGTHAGHAGEGTGLPGDNGFGGGGGAGSYKGNGNYAGGRGGSGIVVLAFEVGGHAGQPEIASAVIDFPFGTTQPRATVEIGGASASDIFSAAVTVTMGTSPDAMTFTNVWTGVVNGQELSVTGDFSPAKGSTIYLQVVVVAEGAQDCMTNVQVKATNEQSPYVGRGGKGVVHVRPGATGNGSGSDWFNACTDFRKGITMLSSERNELWFAGEETLKVAQASINPTVPATIRGGFGGLEDTLSERADDARSTINANNLTAFPLANANALALEGFAITKGPALTKSGAGDLMVTNCVIGNMTGRSISVTGSSAATVRIVDCFFTQACTTSGAGSGGVASFSSVARVFIDNCDFVTNGCPFTTGFEAYGYSQDGAVILASGAPLTVRNSRFKGNRSQALQLNGTSAKNGGVICIRGNCGASAFTNCTFVGNETIHAQNIGSFDSPAVGMFVFAPSAGTLDLVNCTFAHGFAEVKEGAAGVSVRSGTANIRNCIFYGNTNGVSNRAGFDIDVVSGATANIAYSLFEDRAPRRISCAEGGVTNCTGLVYGKPLFVTDIALGSYFVKSGNMMKIDPNKQGEFCAFNCHLRGGSGYVDETTEETVKTWAKAKWRSPAIDTGDPAVRCVEPHPNGRRVNLGFYGNTPWATMSPGGTLLLVR